MDFEEMNQRAYDRKPEPDGLTPAERMIWLALRLLYELHFHGGLTREEGVAYKQELKKDYERNLAQEAEWLRAGTAMKLLRQSASCETCKYVEQCSEGCEPHIACSMGQNWEWNGGKP